MCEAVSRKRRRVGADTVPARPRLCSDHRTLSRMQAEFGGARQRPVRISVLQNSRFALSPVIVNPKAHVKEPKPRDGFTRIAHNLGGSGRVTEPIQTLPASKSCQTTVA